MRKINIGIIGCGYWGPNLVRNFLQIPEVAGVCVCDLSRERRQHIKALYPTVRVCQDAVGIFNDEDIEAVVISTPASSHYAMVKAALLAGKHVLVEKPLATSAQGAEELIRLAEKSRRLLMVGHTFLFNPAVNKLKDAIWNKELGRIYYLHSRRTNLGPLRRDVNAIWDLASHDISIINYLLGCAPLEVAAFAQRFLAHGPEDVGFIVLKYPRDILAHIHVSWLDPKKIREMTVIGSKKMAVYDDIDAAAPIKIYDKKVMKKRYETAYDTFEQFRLIIKDGKVAAPKIEMAEPLKLECRHFIDCLLSGRQPFTNGAQGLAVVKALEAVDKSLKAGSRNIKL
jgi:predicted dehydrogenase